MSKSRPFAAPRATDPRVVRTRAAVLEAGRTLFLARGFAGTTMEDVAAVAGLTKRTVYNNYADKHALFAEVVADVIAFAERFAAGLDHEFTAGITAGNLPTALDGLGRRLALGIVRPEVVALRRLLIGEAREFPALAADYFERAPGQVLQALTKGFRHLGRKGLLRVDQPSVAAAQFAYLVAGAPLDRAVLVGTMPSSTALVACARDGVRTFLARYAAVAASGGSAARPLPRGRRP